MIDAVELPALVLAGGRGTRLAGVVGDRAKAMAPVGGRPFLEWLLQALADQGVRRIVMCVGHRAAQIEEHFGDGTHWGFRITYSREAAPLGTGGALALAARTIASRRVLAFNGDSYCPFDVARLAAAHAERRARATVWLVPVEDASRFGTVGVGPRGEVMSFAEKSRESVAGWVNAGAYIFERAALEEIPADRPVSLETEVFPAWVGRGLYAVTGEGPLLDIGTPESYARAEELLPKAARR